MCLLIVGLGLRNYRGDTLAIQAVESAEKPPANEEATATAIAVAEETATVAPTVGTTRPVEVVKVEFMNWREFSYTLVTVHNPNSTGWLPLTPYILTVYD